MRTEKIVYIPEVISNTDYSDRKRQNINKKAATFAAVLLAMTATGQDRVDLNRTYISSKEGLQDRTTYLVATRTTKQHPKQEAIYTISKNGKSLSLKENSDGTFSVTKELPDKKMLAPILGLGMALTGFAFSLAALLNLNERYNLMIKKHAIAKFENENLKQGNNNLKQQLKMEKAKFIDFRERHPGLGVMSEEKMAKRKEAVINYDFTI